MSNHSSHLSIRRLPTVFGLCVLFSLSGCGKEDPQHYLQEGKALIAKGDTDGARVQFKNALQLDPKLAAAYYELALLDEKKQDWKAMYGNLQETVAANPNHLDAQIKLGQIYLLSGQIDKAVEQAQLAVQLDPSNATAQLLDASIKFRQGTKTEALGVVEQVLAKQPSLPDAVGLKASILASDKQYDSAIAALQPAIEQNPDNTGLRLLKIRLEVNTKNYDGAISDYQGLIAQHPSDIGLRTSLASLLTEAGRGQEAEQTLRETIKGYPAEVELKFKLVELIGRRNTDEAEKALKDFIAESPQQAQLKFRLADYYVSRRRYSDAEALLQEIAAADVKGQDALVAKVKLAEIASSRNDVATVESLVDQVLAVDADNTDALQLRAGVRLSKNDVDGGVSDLRIVLRDRPSSEQALLLMAQAALLQNQVEVAESQWRKVLELNPGNFSATMQLANHLYKRADHAQAENVLNKAIKAQPSNPAPVEMLLQLRTANKDWTGAEAVLEQLKKHPQAAVAAKYWEGFLAASQGQTDAAIKHYQDVLAVQPDHQQSLVAMSRLYEATGRRSELVTYLKDFTTKHPQVIKALDFLASAHVTDKRWGDAEKTLRVAIERAPDDVDLKLKLVNVIEQQSESRAETAIRDFMQARPNETRLKFRLAAYYAARKRYPESQGVLNEVIDSNPAAKEARQAKLKLAELALLQGQSTTAETLLEDILKIEPENLEALMTRASLRFQERDFNGANVDLQAVLKHRPEYDRALLMTAQALQRQGKPDEAEQYWRKVLATQPDNIAALGPLAQNLINRNEWADAKLLLEKAHLAAPTSPQIIELQVQAHLAQKDWDSARKAVAAMKSLPGAEVPAGMWAGTIAMAQGQYDEAIKQYKEVLSKNPKASEAVSALTQASQRAGRAKDLIRYLSAFLQKNPDTHGAHQALAMAYAMDKKWDDAERVLRDKLTLNPRDPQIYALMARLYAEQGKDEQAEATYQKGFAATENNLQLMLERAKFYNFRKQAAKSIAAYEDVLKRYPDNDEAANNLADLLASYQADAQSLERAMKLIDRFKDSTKPIFQDTYGWVQLKSGNVDQALVALKKAVETAPQDAILRYHLGEAYQQQGDLKAAIVELEKSLALAQKQTAFPGIERAQALLSELKSR